MEETQGHAVNYPLIGDADLNVTKLYDMIHPNASGERRAAGSEARRTMPPYARCLLSAPTRRSRRCSSIR
jgi:hypothetical protein